jgi:selenium-binding protein 1
LNQDTGYYFSLEDPYEPKFLKSDRALLASIADEIVAKPEGGFFITYMGSVRLALESPPFPG